MEHRSEIDGLRAIAVLAAIFFHAGLTIGKGGYVGPDIFFVISGYLITGILWRDMEAGRYSILQFYERRARRLLPALTLIMLCSLPFAWALMTISELRDFGTRLTAVSVFAGNIQMWRSFTYFSNDSHTDPLGHMWSLGVEEQFYILFPPLLALFWRFGRKVAFCVILVIAVVSLALSEWGWRNIPIANFTLPQFRAWELMIGAMCALLPPGTVKKGNDYLALIGLVMLILPIYFYDKSMPTPSSLTLSPAIGTVLVILFGQQGTITARLLSLRPFVMIGLVSYSAYLWHQPIFAFARMFNAGELSTVGSLLAILVSFALSIPTWRYVEQPFRNRLNGPVRSKRAVFALSLAAIATLALAGFALRAQGGFPGRMAPDVRELAQARADDFIGLDPSCSGGFTLSSACLSGNRPQMMLWGDSVAMHLAAGLKASDPGFGFYEQTMIGCPPILGIASVGSGEALARTPTFARGCIESNDRIFEWAVGHTEVRYVVLSSRLLMMEETLVDRNGAVASDKVDFVHAAYLETIARLRKAGKKVVVFSALPPAPENVGMCLDRAIVLGLDRQRCNYRPVMSKAEQMKAELLRRLSRDVAVIQMGSMLCEGDLCRAHRNGVDMYLDRTHLSTAGSIALGREFDWTGQVVKLAR